jgi:Uma2 family endonuclease
MVIKEKRLTVEEFWEQYAGQHVELVDGRVIEMPPSGFMSSNIAGRILAKLTVFLEDNPLGMVTGADGGYWLTPETLRVPDVGFVSNAKLATVEQPEKYLPFPPDLAVEVISPTDLASAIQDKISNYLESGTSLVWIIYPVTQTVNVHTPDKTARTLSAADALDGADTLPGFTVKISDLFPNLPD